MVVEDRLASAWGSASPGPNFVRITVYGTEPPGLNALLRMHWRGRKRRQDDMCLALISRGPVPQIKGPVTVEYFRSYHTVPLDDDNLNASFKLVGDALVSLGIVEDDKPKVLRLVASQGLRQERGPRFSVCITPRAT